MEGLVAELAAGAREELDRVAEHGGAGEAGAYMKAALVESNRVRLRRIESGEQVVVGVNRYADTEPSPLQVEGASAFLIVDHAHEQAQLEALEKWRSQRDGAAVAKALEELTQAAKDGTNLMRATLAGARAGATPGEWAGALRAVFGSYRGPTGVGGAAPTLATGQIEALRERVDGVSAQLGRRLKMLVAKPGLDGHSNGAEQLALYARDAGIEVVYEGIRSTPQQIATSALDEGVHVVGLSILSGSHRQLVPQVIGALHDAGVQAPVVVGGIIPTEDVAALREAGVAAVYTPKDFELSTIVAQIVELVAGSS